MVSISGCGCGRGLARRSIPISAHAQLRSGQSSQRMAPLPQKRARCRNHSCCIYSQQDTPHQQSHIAPSAPQAAPVWRSKLLTTALVACISLSGLWTGPAAAEIQGAPSGSATQAAQPLPKQAYDKNKVWLLLLGGAAALFGVTLVIEGQSGLFPAIARSNQILRMSAGEREDARVKALDQVTDNQLEAAVMDGITKSRARQDVPGLINTGNGQSAEHSQAGTKDGSSERQPSRTEDKVTSDK